VSCGTDKNICDDATRAELNESLAAEKWSHDHDLRPPMISLGGFAKLDRVQYPKRKTIINHAWPKAYT